MQRITQLYCTGVQDGGGGVFSESGYLWLVPFRPPNNWPLRLLFRFGCARRSHLMQYKHVIPTFSFPISSHTNFRIAFFLYTFVEPLIASSAIFCFSWLHLPSYILHPFVVLPESRTKNEQSFSPTCVSHSSPASPVQLRPPLRRQALLRILQLSLAATWSLPANPPPSLGHPRRQAQ